MDRISVKANAKINLGLDITGIREDGYHLLKTVMQSVSLYDIVTLEKSDEISVICSDETLPCDEHNLAFKAAKLFFEETKLSGGVKISIEKNIPSQAGLGGGSADAAGTIFALNKLYDAGLSDEKLCKIGEKVGSDVPFCIIGGTKLCEGVGEKLTSLKPIKNCKIVIAKGTDGISTIEAYKTYDKLQGIKHPDVDELINAIDNEEKFSHLCGNVLELTAFLATVDEIKETMIELGAENSVMTGSGSAVFGIFDNERLAEKCCENLKKSGFFATVSVPAEQGIEII